MSEELIPPFTGPISKETAQFRAKQAVDYYHKHLKTQNSKQQYVRDNREHANGYGGREGKTTNIDGRHSAQVVYDYDPPPERFVRGGQRATVHGTNQSGRQWQQNQGSNQVQNNGSRYVPQEHRSGSKKRYSRGLHRSNSNLEESMEYINVDNLDASLASKREYGSTSSLDMMNASTSSDSFFQMLENLRPETIDQRSPAPVKLQEVLRGGGTRVDVKNNNFLRNLEKIANGSVIQHRVAQDETDDGGQSPRSKAKFSKQKDRKLRSKSVITQEQGQGVWKRIMGKNENETGSKTVDSAPETDVKGDDRFRRKALSHYDSQSIGFDVTQVFERKASGSTLANMSTGASAASGTRESFAGDSEAPDITDDGDGQSNELVHSCSFFRNEIGGEEERTVGLTPSTANKPLQVRDSKHSRSAIKSIRSPHCCGVTILDTSPTSVGHILPPHVTCKGHVIEYMDMGAFYYRNFFNGQEHQNYFGIDDNIGPVALSVKREKLEERENNLGKSEAGQYQYRLILRTSELSVLRCSLLEDAIPASGRLSSSRGVPVKDLLEFVAPEVAPSCLRQATTGQKTNDQLLKLDEQRIFTTYKIGILYCRAGQSTEEDMYNNEYGGPAFDEFLNCLGQRVRLKGFEKYRAQLDNKTDSTGTHSVYATFNNSEVMFHVSTLLPYTPKNVQQLLRKRHIGNDIVTVIFQEPGSQPFTAKSLRSQFQHVFIIVRVHNPCSDNVSYSIAVSRSKDVPAFGPTIPENAKFPKSSEFADFLLAKIINAENAAHHSEKFSAMAVRTRTEYLKDLAANFVTSNSLESASKLSKFALSGKKKEKNRGKVVPDHFAAGAVVWHVQVEEVGQLAPVSCYLGIASETLVILEEETKDVIFTTHCGSVIGWTSQALSLRLYYNQGECLVMKPVSADMEELQEIVARLTAVTPGCETEELSLKRNGLGQLGFHIQAEGIVTEVETYGFAYEAGLRKGSRLVEICKVATVTLTHDQMVDLLRTSATVKVVVIPPLKDGGPRGVANLHANHHYSSYPGLNAVIQAEYSHHQKQVRSSSSSSDALISPLSPITPKDSSPRNSKIAKFSPRVADRREITLREPSLEGREPSYRESRESWELREIKLSDKRSRHDTESSDIQLRHDSSSSIQEVFHERESSVSSASSQRSSSNTLPKQKPASDSRGEMKSPPIRTFYLTDSSWHSSSLPRGSSAAGYHGYQDSTVSSGRGSLFEGRDREMAENFGSTGRGLDDSSYGTLEERHTRSGSKDSLDHNSYGSGREWSGSISGRGPQRPPPPTQQSSSHWQQQETSSTSVSTYLTSSTENIYSSSTSVGQARKPATNPDYNATVQHGNYAQELLKQSQNTKYLLSQGSESSRRDGVNSANSSSVNLSDTSFSSGGSSHTANTVSNMPQPASHGDPYRDRSRDDMARRRVAHPSATPHKSQPSAAVRNPALSISPQSSEHSSPRSSQKNLSGMSSEESLSTRLRPGVTTRMGKPRAPNNLEDDLMRLINPDIPDSDIAGLLTSRSSNRRLSGRLVRTMSDESLHSGKSGLLHFEHDIREALFSSRHDVVPAGDQQPSRLSPRVLGDTPPKVPMPDSTTSLDWSSLVDVATKAIEGTEPVPKERISSPVGAVSSTPSSVSKGVKMDSLYRHKDKNRPPDPPTASNPPVWRSVVANPAQRIQELEEKVSQLEEELAQERQESAALDTEVQRLRNENARLQEESQNAAAQLRRFTEWFFTTIDRQ